MQAGDQAVQGWQGQDVRRVVTLPAQPDQAEPGVQPHAERAQGHLPERHLRGGKLSDHQERRGGVLEELVRREVNDEIDISEYLGSYDENDCCALTMECYAELMMVLGLMVF